MSCIKILSFCIPIKISARGGARQLGLQPSALPG